jgi:hypothetical protein
MFGDLFPPFFDFTAECILLSQLGRNSPESDCLAAFTGYVFRSVKFASYSRVDDWVVCYRSVTLGANNIVVHHLPPFCESNSRSARYLFVFFAFAFCLCGRTDRDIADGWYGLFIDQRLHRR